MLINHETKVIFLHNPKCAGMTISTQLKEKGFEFSGDPDWPHNHEVPEELKHYLVVTTVRNPINRYISYYKYVVVHQQKFKGTINEFIAENGIDYVKQEPYINAADIVVPHSNFNYCFKYFLNININSDYTEHLNNTWVDYTNPLYQIVNEPLTNENRAKLNVYFKNDFKLLKGLYNDLFY